MDNSIVEFDYQNHAGKVTKRVVRPIRIYFGSTAWHPEPAWLLEGFDLEKQETRDYAMSGMLSGFRPYTPANIQAERIVQGVKRAADRQHKSNVVRVPNYMASGADAAIEAHDMTAIYDELPTKEKK